MVFNNLGQEFRTPDGPEGLRVDEAEGDSPVRTDFPILVEDGLPDDQFRHPISFAIGVLSISATAVRTSPIRA